MNADVPLRRDYEDLITRREPSRCVLANIHSGYDAFDKSSNGTRFLTPYS